MRFLSCLFGCLLACSAWGDELHFNFGDYDLGSTPTNFDAYVAGGGSPGAWKIISAETVSAFSALSTNGPTLIASKVLAQTGEDMTDEHFPMFVYHNDTYRDFKFTTRFKIASGVLEQMAGVVFRFQNVSNFYVARVSAAGHNIRFYKVVDGVRSDPIGPNVNIPAGQWHKLGAECEGNQITIYLDDKPAMPMLTDNTFTEGRLGFWTKSDSVSYFSDALVEYTPRIPPAQKIIDTVMEKESRLLGLRIYTLQTNNTTEIIASNDKSEIGRPGTDAELQAIQNGTVSYGRQDGTNYVTMPVHDRNGEFIGALRIKSKSFFGETQDTAITRALMVQKRVQELCTSVNELTR